MKFKRPARFLFTTAVLIGLTLAPAVADDAELHSAIRPVPRDADWWTARHDKMNARIAKGKVDLLFIGDSITQAWEGNGKTAWAENYKRRNAVNLGIGGDRTQHVLWRLDHGNIKGVSPKAAVVMIGTNNSGDDTSEHIADGVEAIVVKLRKQLPEMKILVLAIFPRGADDKDPRRQVTMGANKIIAKLADDKHVFYLDIGAAFLADDRTLSKDIMPDLLHLSREGYTIWADSIEPTLKKLMADKE